MPTLNPVRKRIADEGGLEGILIIPLTLSETGEVLQVQVAKGTNGWTGAVSENLVLIHNCAGNMEEVLSSLEQFLTREELIPTEIEFLTDRELLEALHRKDAELERMLKQVQDNQVLLRCHQIEYSYRHPKALGPTPALQRVMENPLEES